MSLEERLIETVRAHTILYDLGHPDYKNLKKKEYAWRDVAAVVKLEEKECRKRWKGLRDSYKRCKRMEQITSGSSAETPKKIWRYYEAMSFLENVASSRCTVDNIRDDDEGDFAEFIKIEPENILSPVSQHLNSKKRKKKDSDNFQDFLNLAASSISETCEAFSTQLQSQDSTYLHFASLAAKIKEAKMPPNIVNQLEAKVSTLVFSEIEKFFSSEQ